MVCIKILGPRLFAGTEDHRRNSLLDVIHRSISMSKITGQKNSKVDTDDGSSTTSKPVDDLGGSVMNLEQALVKARSDCSGSAAKRNCSICGPVRNLPDGSCSQSEEESPSDGGAGDESLAIVPVQNVEAASTSITMLVRQLPESRPGWPLLRRAIFPDRRAPDRSSLRKISVVQWALRLPTRQPSYLANSDVKQITYDPGDNESINLNGDSGAIVPVGNEIVSSPLSTDHDSTELPKELEGLHEKYSATCRLFNYQDLLSATSNFLAGLC